MITVTIVRLLGATKLNKLSMNYLWTFCAFMP